ncbi:ubiquitin carboxyl-terminal hydrolase 8-like [Leptopilina heterotoma]|uniref:ubiquitin carboxyl-terminal hydrolase 8-like n=1 Tax=Leptopilina heterotoma TaxID=63436 RepID=UPI001CA89A7C|nr:ubiquitin carboxyl-terminal hydrolase 8-like [Leptopilina heterotoma]XP_043462619.1 ubiquitin carboxyl-terminal hydrolase 8-like [Leptopilina heterotoma]
MANTKSANRIQSIQDLNKKSQVNLSGFTLKNLFSKLNSVRDQGKEALKSHKEEEAYIYFRRWQNCVEHIKNSENRSGKRIYSLLVSEKEVDEIKNELQKLNEFLTSRINKAKTLNSELGNTNAKSSLINSYADDPLSLPEIPPEDPVVEDSEEITCMQLYQLLKSSDNKILLIDVRPQNDFTNSHIQNEKCINIPSEEIKKGILCKHFENLFKDKESKKLFENRKSSDIVVLLDWYSTEEFLKDNGRLNAMKDLLQNWDPGAKYKRISTLQGGYNEWLTRYPQFVTNHDVKPPDVEENALNEILENFEFPSIDDDILSVYKSNKKDNLVDKKQLRKSQVNNHINSDENVIQPMNKTHDSGNKWRSSESLHDQKSINSFRIENGISDKVNFKKKDIQANILNTKVIDIPKPMFDRSNKPSSSLQQNTQSKVHSLMESLYVVKKNYEELDNVILQLEEKWLQSKLLNDNQLTKTISDKLFLQKDELKNLDEKRIKLENELKSLNYSKEDALKIVNQQLQSRFLINEQNQISISSERKKIHESFKQKREQKHSLSQIDESDILKEPLKDTSSTNASLTRSYSSPNLVQMEDQKVPEIDRTSKPSIATKENRITNVNNNIKRSSMNLKDREDRMEPVYRGERHPGITGLKNLGNSCYMNSIIQCLSNTANLAKYFNDNSYVEDLNNSNENGTQAQVTEEVAHVIKALWRGQYKSISPRDLKVVIGQYRLQFESYEQQDSHEFLTFLLEWMHNDLKRKDKVIVNDLLTSAEKEWIKAMNGQKSMISRLFFGQYRSTITCATCGKNSVIYETFNNLTMSLPPTKCTLDDCVKKYVSGQRVFGWKCPHCKVEREATKKFDFIKLAPIVVIHLNRFGESDGWLEKRNTQVDFPLTDFNLRPYVVNDTNTNINTNNLGYNYSLYAMSNHYGTMEGGHYTAYCKSAPQNKWYKYDDHTVAEVSSNQVKSQNSSAYLLFYTSLQTGLLSYI